MSTDAELLAKIIVEDDREAFEVLLKKYQSPVRAFFRKMTGDEALSDDLAQETFFKAYRGLRSYQGQAQFLTWLYAIAKNVFYEHLRNRVTTEELQDDSEAGSYNMVQDRNLDLAKCMLKLEPEERMILTLSYSEGLAQTEVAELMGIPLGTVKTHTLRAKEKLKSYLVSYQARSI